MDIDYKKAERWLQREKKEIPKYVQTEAGKEMPSWHVARLKGYPTGQTNIGEAAGSLFYLANYEGAIGCDQVLRGDTAGFGLIDRACLYNFWHTRLVVRLYELDERPDKQPRMDMETVAPCWMHATAIGARDIREWLDDRIEEIDAGENSIGGKGMNPLCTLMAHFVTGRNARDLKERDWGSVAAYAPVVDRTLTPPDYELLADYHQKNTNSGGYQPFWTYPYRPYPIELLAIEKLNAVAITNPKHPLLTTPLMQRREVKEIPIPPDLAAIIAKATAELSL